jgi:dethiobiotin synthetase
VGAGVFVTGSGTGVGKTVVAAVIARTLAEDGARVAVFKPAVSGLDDGGGPDHALLRLAARSPQSDGQIAPYRFGPAVSPHLAAEMEGRRIDPEFLLRTAHSAADSADVLVCEGVGGFLVPLTEDYLVRDFARDLGLPVVIAAPPVLGTINHTLLTLESVRLAGLEIDRVVLTPWPETPSPMERDNRATIERLGQVRVDTIPQLEPETWPALEAVPPAPHP